MAKVVYEMEKKTAAHYEHIDGMSEEFQGIEPEDLTPELASWWSLRINLAIAQQLSVISQTLKERQ